ncbi:MAG: conjugal transfer protein TraF, partial [Thalassolituus sp.]
MLKRTLLGSAILLAGTPALATPYMPMDARGLAMGNTGVASARLAHAPAYNPSLLSHRRDGDNFALLFPQIGINLADEEEVIDKGEEIGDDIMPRFADLFDDAVPGNLPDAVSNLGTAADDLATAIENNGDVATASTNFANAISETQSVVSELNSASNDLTDSLDAISGSPLRGRLGVSAAIAIPTDLIAVAVSARADANFSARSIFTDQDQNNILAYGQATSEYLDAAADANSQVAALQEYDDPMSTEAQAAAASAAAALDNLVNFESVSSVTDNSGSSPVFENGDISTAAEDPSFNSKVEIAAIAVAEVGLTLSKALEVEGRKFALGVTPKIQAVSTYH